MITLANGNSYEVTSYGGTARDGWLKYSVTNPAAQALGFPTSSCVVDISAMTAMQTFFTQPMQNQLPTLADIEAWIVSDHSADGQAALQMFTGGVLS